MESGIGLMQCILRIFPMTKSCLRFCYKSLKRPCASQGLFNSRTVAWSIANTDENLLLLALVARPKVVAG